MRAYYYITGIVFVTIAVLHFLRFVFEWQAVIAGFTVPVWFSLLAALLAGVLAGWSFLRAL